MIDPAPEVNCLTFRDPGKPAPDARLVFVELVHRAEGREKHLLNEVLVILPFEPKARDVPLHEAEVRLHEAAEGDMCCRVSASSVNPGTRAVVSPQSTRRRGRAPRPGPVVIRAPHA